MKLFYTDTHKICQSIYIEIILSLHAIVFYSDTNKDMLLGYRSGAAFSRLVSLASTSPDVEIQYNSAGTLGQLVLKSKINVTNINLILYVE